MGQKVNPISNRLGVIRGWDSNWYGGKKYGETLLEDSKIRKYLRTRLAKASVSRIIIERTLKMVTVTICTSRPGMIIGKGGKFLKNLGVHTRKYVEDLLDTKCMLKLFVKVDKDWRTRSIEQYYN